MPSRPKKPSVPIKPDFWDFGLTKKILAGVLFFAIALFCGFVLIPFFRSDVRTLSELILPGLLILSLVVALIRLALRKNGFAALLLGLALLGGLAGWGLRFYSDQVAAQKVIVLVTQFAGGEDKYALREQVLKELTAAAGEFPLVEIVTSNETVTSKQGADVARELGRKAQADLVLWGWYQPDVAPMINLFVEDITPAALELPLPKDAGQPQPVLDFLSGFQLRRAFSAKSDTFSTFISALLSYKSGNYQTFLDRTAKILSKTDPSMVVVPYDLNFYIGVSHSARNELQPAIDAYTSALKANRKGAVALNNRALAYIELKQYDLAIKDCNLAFVIDNRYSLLFNTRGIAYLGTQDYKNAIKDFAVAIVLDPSDPRFYHNRALAFQASGQVDFATADFKKEAELRANP